jgi:hypothetical protein
MAETLQRKLELAQLRERNARARTARLRRSLDSSNRKRQTQVKCTIGAAVLALAASGKGEGLVTGLRRWLDHYLSRPQDRNILSETPFALDLKGGDNAAV